MKGQPADRLVGESEEQRVNCQNKRREEEAKEKAKKVKKPQKVPKTVLNTTGATIGTVNGGTVYANTTSVRGNSYVQYGHKSQQKWYNKGGKSDSESEDDSNATDESSD